jgi:hypothetical protein
VSTEPPPEIGGLLAAYHELGRQIAQHEVEIAGLRHKQALLIGLMNDAGISYRTLGPMLGVSPSRAHQLRQEKRVFALADIDDILTPALGEHL